MDFIKNLFLGRLLEEEANVEVAIASIEDIYGNDYKVILEGNIRNLGRLGIIIETGSDKLFTHLSSRKTILACSDNKFVPINNIKTIKVIIKSKICKYTYRK